MSNFSHAHECMNVIKVTLSQLTVAGALNKSYRLQVSVVSENGNSHVRSSKDVLNNCFEVGHMYLTSH